jgi:hypothetical protein
MDSRVAVTAASILYDIQNLPADHIQQGRELTDEDYSELSGQFLSCNWRLDDSEEVPNEQLNPLTTLLQPFVPDPNIQSLDSSNLVASRTNPLINEPSMNGVDCKYSGFCVYAIRVSLQL